MLVKEFLTNMLSQMQVLADTFKDLPTDYLLVLSFSNNKEQFDINIDHEGQRVFMILSSPSLYATEKETE